MDSRLCSRSHQSYKHVHEPIYDEPTDQEPVQDIPPDDPPTYNECVKSEDEFITEHEYLRKIRKALRSRSVYN